MTSTKMSRHRWTPYLLTFALSLALALLPLVFNPRFYFVDDTESQYAGNWYYLGQHLLHGELTLQNFDSLMSGNFIGEFGYGQFNPFIVVFMVIVALTPNVGLAFTGIKVFLIVTMALGGHLAARTVGVSKWWATPIGVSYAMCGFTTYFDAPSWIYGLWVSASLPFLLVALWRTPDRDRLSWVQALLVLPAAYLVMSAGYAQGLMITALAFGSTTLIALLRRQWRRVMQLVILGLASMLAVAPYFGAGLLSTSVSWRGDPSIRNTQFNAFEIGDLLNSAWPSYLPETDSFATTNMLVPSAYAGVVLLLLIFVDFSRLRGLWRETYYVLSFTAVALAISLGPSDIGQARWPFRFFPYVALGALLICGWALTRSAPLVVSRTRILLGIGVLATSLFLAASAVPGSWKKQSATAFLLGVLLLVFAASITKRLRVPTVAAAIVAVVVFTGWQRWLFPESQLMNFGTPTNPAQMRENLGDLKGRVLQLGGYPTEWTWDQRRAAFDEIAIGSTAYFPGYRATNTYTPLGFATFSDKFCMIWTGQTCNEAVSVLQEREPRTGLKYEDLMGIDTLLLWNHVLPNLGIESPGPGWTLQKQLDHSQVWVRERTWPGGSVVWHSDTIKVSGLDSDPSRQQERSESMEVSTRSGGSIVFSRLDWPGYSAEVDGRPLIVTALDGMFVTVEVPPQTQGTLTLDWTPPGWPALWLLPPVAVLLGLLAAVLGRRSREGADREATDEPSAMPHIAH